MNEKQTIYRYVIQILNDLQAETKLPMNVILCEICAELNRFLFLDIVRINNTRKALQDAFWQRFYANVHYHYIYHIMVKEDLNQISLFYANTLNKIFEDNKKTSMPFKTIREEQMRRANPSEPIHFTDKDHELIKFIYAQKPFGKPLQ